MNVPLKQRRARALAHVPGGFHNPEAIRKSAAVAIFPAIRFMFSTLRPPFPGAALSA